MRTYYCKRKAGITRTKEFERKGLATYAINVGFKCGHGCLYCSTGAMLRTNPCFKKIGEDPFGFGYTVIDPSIPEKVARDAKRIKKRGMIQLCTTTDAWSPEAQVANLGRRCLQAILDQPGWTVRILTRNAAVVKDFDLIEKHKDRVLVGLSITGSAEDNAIIKTIEPGASFASDRIGVMDKAHDLGLRTYAMLCPLMPEIGDKPCRIEWLIQLADGFHAEEIFVEPVNPRGRGLMLCQQALDAKGYHTQANAVGRIRHRVHWSHYVVRLLCNTQAAVRRHSDIRKLRFLLYPSNLLPEDKALIRQDDEGVAWLGKR